jgi:hypothetical protein
MGRGMGHAFFRPARRERVMDLTTWLIVMLVLGVLTLGLMALFVTFCDKV